MLKTVGISDKIYTNLHKGAIIFYFYFFFDDLYYIPAIQQAFRNVCLDKMLSDGYFDMSAYIYGRLKKETIYAELTSAKSEFAVLYQGSYPTQDNALTVWREKIGNNEAETWDPADLDRITYSESCALVNWVYRAMKNAEQRENFTKELLHQLKELHSIKNNIRFSRGVVYNAAKVDIHFLSSVSAVNTFLSSLKKKTDTLFYRGHADANYILLPSIMRTNSLQQHESLLYHELLINCPDDFEKCHTHLEKLVKMQHYGLPTRLLDITRNPLVGLYFACESRPESYGELVLISPKNHEIKYPQSDTVSILASLSVFSQEKQQDFLELAEDPSISAEQFNQGIARLIHEVRLEKPAFQAEVQRADVLSNFIVYALKNNGRIIKQDGAFILCGLSPADSMDSFRYRERGKKVIVLLDKKKQILDQLETFSINHAALFPEVECVAEYLKNKYNH